MNENIDLTKILKNCPIGTKLYSPIWGELYFEKVCKGDRYSITTTTKGSCIATFTKEGLHYVDEDGECILFPSKDQRDWNKFEAPWYKKEKFDPNTLKPFDKVLVRDSCYDSWKCMLFSHIIKYEKFPYVCSGRPFVYCIPYNDDTKHLVGIKDEAPEYYTHWDK